MATLHRQGSHFLLVRTFMKRIFQIFLVVIITGCACPTDLDDEGKVVRPTVYCNVSFVSAAPDNRILKVKTEFRTIVEELEYEAMENPYVRTEASETTLKIFGKEDRLLYQNRMMLHEKEFYTLFVHGFNSALDVLILNDPLNVMNNENAYYRCVNLSADSPGLLIRVTGDGQENYLLDYKGSSGIVETRSREYDIQIIETQRDTVLYSLDNVSLQAGYFYNIIIRGYYSIFSHMRLECKVTGNKI